MVKLRRITCVLFAALFLVTAPAKSYGAPAVAVAVGGYTVGHVLAACGVLAGTAAVTVLIGTWDDRDTYLAQGAAKKLGAYAQNVYDKARDTASGAAEKYQQIEETMISLVTAGWGDTVSGVQLLVEDIKPYLKTIYGYGYTGELWHVPTVPVDQTWAESEWSTLDFYPLPTAGLVPPVSTDGNHTLFLTNYLTCAYAGAMNVLNWYYLSTADIFGIYDPVSMVLTTYQRNAEESTYSEYRAYACSAYVNEDGSLRFSYGSTSWWQRATMLCTPADAGSLSFPVFGTVEDAEHYVATGEAINTYVSGTMPMEVDAFREDIAALDAANISDVFTLPETEDIAAERLALLESTFADASAAELSQVLTDSGLAVDVTDIPGEDVDEREVVGAITALPGQIADAISDLFTMDSDQAQENLSLPAMVANKFPFCIPFDFIYLVQSLAAEKEVPVFEFPVKFDYEDFHYEHTFVLDMSVFDPAIDILRIMLDLLFCSWLISATRHLIRG